MKKLIISALALGMISSVNVQAKPLTESAATIYKVQEKVAIKPEDLPEAVKTTLASNTYLGWEVTAAFLITKQDNSQYYEIAAKKGTETATINLDKDGKKVE